ncbi:unnamed protein product [Amaranthus hypochondriacus]
MEFYNHNAWSNNLAADNFLPNSLDDQIGGAAEILNIPLPPPLYLEAPLTFNIPLLPFFDILPCLTNETTFVDNSIITGRAQPTLTIDESPTNSFSMEQNQQQNSWNFDDQYKQGGQSSNLIQEEIVKSEILTRESEDSNHENTIKNEPEQNSFFKSANHKGLDDGYNWRKYGNKEIIKNKSSKGYFKCSYPNCPGKKTIGTTLNGHNITVVNTKEHNHPKPANRRRSSSLTYQNDLSSRQFELENSLDSQRWSSGGDDLDDDEPQAKRRNDPNKIVSEVKEPRVVIQVTSDNDVLDDGYKWRKYGAKVVKGNPNPRLYYKCTSKGCLVKKQVERAADDPKEMIISYEDKHNHDVPTTRGSSRSAINIATEVSSMATIPSPENYMLLQNKIK